MLLFGDKDDLKGFSDPKALHHLEEALAKAGKSDLVTTVLFPGSGHAFMNELRPEAYHEANSKKAFDQTIAFFSKHLQ